MPITIRTSFFFATFVVVSLAAGQGNDQNGRAHAPKISAHRGASRIAPENTLRAFSAAMESGADFIELDVRTTLDGREVCLHDASLKRTTGFDAKVQDVSYEKIKTLATVSASRSEFASEKIPSLEEVCQLVTGRNNPGMRPVNLYVDCKDILVPKVIAILKHYALLDSAVFYGDVITLRAIRKIAPTARLLPPYPGPVNEEEIIRTLRPFGFDVSWTDLNASLVKRCHQRGTRVFCDLLDENDTITCYLKVINDGIDLIQTDDVEAVRQAIAQSRHAITE